MPDQSLGQGQTTNKAKTPLHIKTMLYSPGWEGTAFLFAAICRIIGLYYRYAKKSWVMWRGILQRLQPHWMSHWKPSCAAISISCKNATRMALIRRRPFNAGKGIPNARFECISYASLKQRTFICGTEIRCWRYCAKKAPFDLSDCKEMRP